MTFLREILMETKRIGAIQRIAAVDADSGTEVVFQAPASASPEEIRRIAASKLRYVMEKKEKAAR
ncbi:MAG: hypothetical protein P4M13_05590 [Alphaproteobacteria bacterium]|nr:hypothetical protein [Alphaproteobacteria bacterium]